MPVGWMDLRRKLFWVSVLYFAEGFPFGIAIDNLPVYFRLHGVSLTEIGLMSLLGAPWTLKVLWAPLVDRFGTRQHWFVSCLATLALVMAALPFFNPSAPTIWLWALLMLLTTASATQDIAIDAYTIGLLAPGEEGIANGVRVSAYRVALIASGGGLVILAGPFGWPVSFLLGAAILAGLAVLAGRSPAVRVPPTRSAAELVHPAPALAAAAWRADGVLIRPDVQARREQYGTDDQAVLGRSRSDGRGDRFDLHHARGGRQHCGRAGRGRADHALGNLSRLMGPGSDPGIFTSRLRQRWPISIWDAPASMPRPCARASPPAWRPRRFSHS